MSHGSHCFLTSKDHAILQSLRERAGRDLNENYLHLLDNKLSTAIIVLHQDVPRNVATLNSRVDYSVNGGPIDSCVLINNEELALAGMTLPITSLRGLALLGMVEGGQILIEHASGARERITLNRVAYQPEAARKRRAPAAPAENAPAAPVFIFDRTANRGKFAPAADLKEEPDDDDPGPNAA